MRRLMNLTPVLLLFCVAVPNAWATQATLVVDSDPRGATVLVDGGEYGVTPLETTVDLARDTSRECTVTVRMQAYNDAERKVTLSAGERTDLGVIRLISPHPLPPGARPLPDQKVGVMEAGYAVVASDGAVMVWVPAGPFTAGYPLNYARGQEAQDMNPYRTVELDGFWIDRYEVTNSLYKAFVDATGAAAPANWVDGKIPGGEEDYPVVNVTEDDADAYARWARKRLPTEDQWEKAARGPDDMRVFPWGDKFEPGDANIGRAAGGPKPVGSFPKDLSPYGVYDMAGNVREWVVGTWEGHPDRLILRGGSFGSSEASDNPEFAMIPCRGWITPDVVPTRVHLTGFRCVVSG